MRKISVATAAFVAISALCVPASAATIISTNNGSDLAEVIHGTSMGTTTSTTLSLVGLTANLPVQYLSSDVLSTTGQGVAQVTGNGGGFTDLTITPLSNFTFTAFKFNLDIPKGPTGGATNDFTFDAKVFFAGGGSQLFDNFDIGDGNGANRFLITAGANELINKIVLSDLTLSSTKGGHTTITDPDFSAIKQASFDYVSGVPEPATWAEFILGFGLTGVMLRRRRNQTAAVPA